MKYVLIGKLVNTHGLKGEVRILSNFKYKDRVFVPGMKIYIGKDKICEKINEEEYHEINKLCKGYVLVDPENLIDMSDPTFLLERNLKVPKGKKPLIVVIENLQYSTNDADHDIFLREAASSAARAASAASRASFAAASCSAASAAWRASSAWAASRAA